MSCDTVYLWFFKLTKIFTNKWNLSWVKGAYITRNVTIKFINKVQPFFINTTLNLTNSLWKTFCLASLSRTNGKYRVLPFFFTLCFNGSYRVLPCFFILLLQSMQFSIQTKKVTHLLIWQIWEKSLKPFTTGIHKAPTIYNVNNSTHTSLISME